MGSVELACDERPELVWRFRVLSSVWERLKGLLGTAHDAAPVLLLRCSSVHTYAMRYALDLAFLGTDGSVLLTCAQVGPGHVVTHRDAFCVLERPASQEPWFREGERVRMLSFDADGGAPVCPRERIGYEL